MCTKKNVHLNSAQKTEPCQTCQGNASAKFCTECGNKIITTKEPLPEPAKPTETVVTTSVKDTTGQPGVAQKCGRCGSKMIPSAMFCSQCGDEVVKKPTFNIVCKCKDNTELTGSITTGEFVIGQADDCNMVIPDGYVSRHHTKVFLSDGKLMLEDMGSSNGTFIRIREPMAVTEEDEILIGTNILKIKA